jgi:peptidoglycan-associated lipoprotein
MKIVRVVPLLLLGMAAAGACRKKPPAGPQPYTSTATDSAARARADSLRADSLRRAQEGDQQAERDRLERERRQREAATSVARNALTEIVFFQYDSDEISPDAEQKLAAKAAVLRANPGVRLRIEGHCDQRGSTEYNLALGQRRAEAVRAYLLNLGVDGSRLATMSYGKERPLEEGESEEAFARNRRAEFEVLAGEITTVPTELRR